MNAVAEKMKVFALHYHTVQNKGRRKESIISEDIRTKSELLKSGDFELA